MFKVFKNLKWRDWLFIALSVGLIVLQVWLDLTMPDYTSKLSTAIASGTPTMSAVWENGGMMLLCAFGSLAASLVCGFLGAQVAANLAKTLRLKLFDRITDFSNAEIDKFSTPSLITRTTNDVVQIQMMLAMGLQVIVKAPVLAIWALCKISATSIEWTTATLITVVVMVLLIGIIVAITLPKFKKIQKLTDDLNEVTRENLSGVRVVRAFNAEQYQEEKFADVNNKITKNHLVTSRAMGMMNPIMTLCMSGLTLAIYWIGAFLLNNVAMSADLPAELLAIIGSGDNAALQNALAANSEWAGIFAQYSERLALMGDMVAFTQYALQVVMAFMLLIAIFIMVPRAMVSGKRISEVLDTQTSIKFNESGAEEKDGAKGKVQFNNVSFAYSDGEHPCLKNLNFTVESGQTFAIIGATGAGKTSLVNLITRFYDATDGEVLIDGINIKDYSQKQLESKVSIAPQKAILFSGDIKSNVTYGSEEELSDGDERIAKALEIAQAEFVGELEKGIHSEVAQGGTNFSGGQKQRLSIARAVFRDADVIIFDDTFSALDYKTDMLVRKALNENLDGTTKIIVAQRIGTIKNADQILVLDDGGIAGLGKHEQLLESCPVYKEIALSQLSQDEIALSQAKEVE